MSAADLDATQAPRVVDGVRRGPEPALTASAVVAETELLRVGVGPSFAAETANVDGSASASVPLSANAVAADTELLRIGPGGQGSGPANAPLTASAVAADTELLRVTPGRRAAGPARAAGRMASPMLAETRATAAERTLDETQAGRSIAGGEETVVRSDVRFAGGDEEVPAALQAVLSAGRIGRFVILRELGRGAMGVVLAAYDAELDRRVAIKVLHATRGYEASHGRAMLLREAQAMARLAHPNVVAVHEVGVAHGAVFVAMEYVAGVDLQRWLADRPRPWREVVAVFLQAGAGLMAAHREGLVHRDFKPSNVLVGEDGRARVADFGLAARRQSPVAGAPQAHAPLTATLAPEGALVGTPVYMAPELLRGGSATPLSDQFAFCVALYEALHGARPFAGDTLASLTEDVEGRALPAAPPRAEVPAWLHAAVCRGLAKAPHERFASLGELMELLARDPEEERRQRRRRALQFVGAIVGTAVIVTLAVFAYGAVRRYAAERQAESRLEVLRGQIGELRARGDDAEAGRLLRSFVALPENRGLPVVARAYLEWAAAQTDPAEAVDAYASAYITARTDVDGSAALLGLIDRLAVQGRIPEAAAALAALERAAPAVAAAPELLEVRRAAALARRDLGQARAVLAAGDDEGWSPVFEDLLHVTEFAEDHFGGPVRLVRDEFTVVDVDGDGASEVAVHRGGAELRIFRADVALTPVRTVDFGEPHPKVIRALAPVVAGEPLALATYPGAQPEIDELRLLDIRAQRARTLDGWADSPVYHPLTLDFAGDGRREIYVGTEAYARRLWRIERAADGTWSRRTAHGPTEAAGSDINAVLAADLEGDGRPELVAAAGPWKAYDLRVYMPTATGELDLVARRAFGSFGRFVTLRAAGRDLVAFTKSDFQVAPNRFPADKPLGEPAGVYVVGLREGAIEVLGHVPERPEAGPRRQLAELHAGDLDGDGHDELVIDGREQGMSLLRVRPGQPLRVQQIAGLRPALVADVDGDGKAEILAQASDRPGRLLLLGAGEATLPPLPPVELAPRPIPPGIADPVIAEAWAHAEQLVAIGLPRRTAAELSAIARLSGHVSSDILMRAGELYAGLGEDAAAAEHYEAAATRADLAPAALAGAAAARRRLGEFAAAAELTRQRAAVAGGDTARSVAAELAALDAAIAPRPELALTFARPLDRRWQIFDPVGLQRALARRSLSVWVTPAPALAEFSLAWDGGPAALEIEFEIDRIEWGTSVSVAVLGQDDEPWLQATIGGHGLSDRPEVHVEVGDDPRHLFGPEVLRATKGRLKVAVFPGLQTTIRERELGAERARSVVATAQPALAPPPGPLRLRVASKVLQTDFVGHVWISAIRLTGFAPGEAAVEADESARQLAEGERAQALRAVGAPAPGSDRQLWRIDALLGLGEIEAAARESAALLAVEATHGSRVEALLHRLRRGEAAASLAARAALGPRLVDLLFHAQGTLDLKPADVELVLEHLPASDPKARPTDPLTAQRLALADFARGQALAHVGRFAAAREALEAAFARVEAGPEFPLRARLRPRLLRRLLELATAMADRDETMRWIRVVLGESQTPYLALERMQSEEALVRLFGPEVWESLAAELRATRP